MIIAIYIVVAISIAIWFVDYEMYDISLNYWNIILEMLVRY